MYHEDSSDHPEKLAPASGTPPHVLILAAGYGTRLGHLAQATPKCLVPVAGQAPLDRWADLLATLPPTQITVNTHHMADQVQERVAAYDTAGPHKWYTSHEPDLLGSAGTLRQILHQRDIDDILVIYADNISSMEPCAFWQRARALGSPITLGLFRADDPRSCGLVETDARDQVLKFEEKPDHPKTDLAFAGVIAASADALRDALTIEHHDIGKDLLPDLIGQMAAINLNAYHRDMGTPTAITQIENDALAGLWHPRRCAT